jgi:hypothetical protein
MRRLLRVASIQSSFVMVTFVRAAQRYAATARGRALVELTLQPNFDSHVLIVQRVFALQCASRRTGVPV